MRRLLFTLILATLLLAACTRRTATPVLPPASPTPAPALPLAPTPLAPVSPTPAPTGAPATTAPPPPAAPATPTATAPRPTAAPAAAANPFGVLMNVNSAPMQTMLKSLGVAYFRTVNALTVEGWNGACLQCDIALQAGLKLILTVRNNGGGMGNPTSPPTDLAAYKQTLGQILDKFPPVVLAVENEENSSVFYTGTPEQYAQELQAGCEVAHSKGILCTNGGMVSSEVALLVWADYAQQGNLEAGCSFARRALEASEAQLLCNAGAVNATPARVRQLIEKGQALIQVYKSSAADYTNFHWYITDPAALEEAVNYLRAATGKPVMTNEMGQQGSADPSVIAPLLQKAVDLDLPYIVWYSVDAPQARALQDQNGTLRPNGEAFRTFVQNYVTQR